MTGPALVVDGIARRFGGVRAVDGASFTVQEGSITGLIGPNGAGKTTAFNIISGFLRADAGAVTFRGRRLDSLPPHRVAQAGVVRTFQAPRILTRMSVLENLMLGGVNQPGERLALAWLHGSASRREREVRAEALAVLELLRLTHLAPAYAGTLSGGQRKLLELGRALMAAPRVLLLDEPLAGVAPALADQLLDHVTMLRNHRGMTILIIEHDMEAVMSICDWVVAMDQGRVIASGTPRQIQANEQVIASYLGSAGTAPR
ncbi:MAG TPA: ABC transporter ATP-binding protein [bacterium]|nr:ABC transporter ATP-binding protein [bacterium]